MINSWLQKTICHSCGNEIKEGQLFCKYCGRSRGPNKVLQFKKWELMLSSASLFVVAFLCFTVTVPFLAGIAIKPPVTKISTYAIPSTPTKRTSPTNAVSAADTQKPPPTSKPQATSTPKGIDFTTYSCPDKTEVKLRVGSRAVVSFDYVNLRSSPLVPDVWDANIVMTLREGDKMLVIGGPKCAYEGTWWEVQTNSGHIGWVREIQGANKVLLKPIN